MESKEIRKKFLDFFEKRGHKIVPSSSLLPTDPSVLFTTAGMQQFKEYFLGKKSPFGNRVTSCQKCFRTSDIDNIGDDTHLTFIEMLGNFSFGDYFKEEAIKLAYEFIVKELGLEIDFVSVFAGDPSTSSGQVVPEDKESEKIWLNLGIPQTKIKKMGREDNFWGPTGLEGPCGPTSEIYFNNVEVWNLVFNEYYQDRNGKLTPLKQKGVDTGMGLERLAAVVHKKESVFETDSFLPLIKEIEKKANKPYSSDFKSYRIIVDHIKSAVFLISEGILPSNVEKGYILRRILRRAIRYGKLVNLPKNFSINLAQKVIEIYKDVYPEVKSKENDILVAIQNEEEKFEKTFEKGLKIFERRVFSRKPDKYGRVGVAYDQLILYGKEAFDLYQTYGFPPELMKEICKERNVQFDENGFQEEQKKHQEISRAGVEKKFGGVGKDAGLIQVKLHSATHLLHAALREILGKEVKQMGSDITPQRLRFDFSYSRKLTPEEIKKVEDLVNQKIKEDLEVKKEEMDYQEAIKSGALAFFKDKYPEKVSVFTINKFSKEICAGPHVNRTSELGHFKIIKEESSGAGVRRIRAILLTPAR
jgi:alanyl-tRNA synthetase